MEQLVDLQDQVQDYLSRLYLAHWGVSLDRLLEIRLMAKKLIIYLQQQVVSEEHLDLDY